MKCELVKLTKYIGDMLRVGVLPMIRENDQLYWAIEDVPARHWLVDLDWTCEDGIDDLLGRKEYE